MSASASADLRRKILGLGEDILRLGVPRPLEKITFDPLDEKGCYERTNQSRVLSDDKARMWKYL
jgi:hypothetical protein